MVFNGIYGFGLGTGGLPYLGFIVSGVITVSWFPLLSPILWILAYLSHLLLQFTFYWLYQKYHMEPRMFTDPNYTPEARLELGIVAGCFVPISLFMFGWSARESVHW